MNVETANLALRGLLELAALCGVALWGLRTADGLAGIGLAVGLVAVVAVLWGVFRVPDDPGPAPVAIPGPARLALEGVLFGLATAALFSLSAIVGLLFGAHVLIHYAIDHERVRWLATGA